MSTTETHDWIGASGKQYKYSIHSLDTSFKEKAGNYIFAKLSSQYQWVPVYIGQAENLKDRLSNHNKEDCALKHGATHIHAHLTSGGEIVRLAEEKDLLLNFNTPCNVQHNS